MRWIIALFAFLVLVSTVVAGGASAAEETAGPTEAVEGYGTEETASFSDPPEPGVTPDSVILWKVDVWTEQGLTALTLDQEEKISKSLRAAQERLTEVEEMLRKEKEWSAQKALDEHDELIENVRSSIVYFDYQEKEKEFQKEYAVQELLHDYAETVSHVQEKLGQETFNEETNSFIAEMYESLIVQQQTLAQELETKKEETRLKIKANGLSDEELMVLEAGLSAGVADLDLGFLDVSGVVEELPIEETTLEETVEEIDPILAYVLAETDDIVEEAEAVIDETGFVVGFPSKDETTEETTDTSSNTTNSTSNKTVSIVDTSMDGDLSVSGEITAVQESFVEAIHNALVSEGTDAEIEITVVEVQAGAWKIEKEVDGLLSSSQETLLDSLLYALSDDPHDVRIKIRYDPDDTSSTIVGTTDEGISTEFVIG